MIPIGFIIYLVAIFTWLFKESNWMRVRLPVGACTPPIPEPEPIPESNQELLAQQYDETVAEIESLNEFLANDKARKYISLAKKSGDYKGEVLDLTPRQFSDTLGFASANTQHQLSLPGLK